MIEINFKNCCMECGNIDVDYDYMENIIGKKSVCIYCAHMKVCKMYNDDANRRVKQHQNVVAE